jgi:hypothetical protein
MYAWRYRELFKTSSLEMRLMTWFETEFECAPEFARNERNERGDSRNKR